MSTNITDLFNLPPDNTDPVKLHSVDETDDVTVLSEIFFDGNESLITRLKALEKIWIVNCELCAECVNKISSMFMFAPTDIFRKLLKYIVINGDIDINIKNECARAIYDDNKKSGYECFLYISKNMSTLPTPLQFDIIRILLETDIYYDATFKLLVSMITNQKIDCEYRYKSLLSIQRDKSRHYIPKYLDGAYFEFVKDSSTYTRYRIIASQYILQNKSITKDSKELKELKGVKDEVERICVSFASDTQLDYNIRADAADLLIRLGSKDAQDIGRDIITLLGRNAGGLTTVYTDRQNVHDNVIDESIKKFILEISSTHTKTNSDGNYITFNDVQKEIEKLVNTGNFDRVKSLDKEDTTDKDDSKHKKTSMDKVRSSLLRISIDQTVYDGGQTLHSIFNKVWQIIESHEFSDVLKTRVVEELIDMADTCSSGHISRIINILSGFDVNGKTIGIDIGWKKQIQSNLLARLNAKIKHISDTDSKSTILDEMITSGDITSKPSLNIFFRDNLLPIRNEMFDEFVGGNYIKDDEFEEYFRSAIAFFEEG